MQLRTTFLTLILLSSAATSSESTSSSEENITRHLREPSGQFDEVSRLSARIGTMNERQLLAALRQYQSTPEEKSSSPTTAYEELYALASLKSYTESFMAEVNTPLIARLIFRPTEIGESTLVFPSIFKDIQDKSKKAYTDPSASELEEKYQYYRKNVDLLLQTWGTITICGEKLFDDTMSTAVKYISDQSSAEKNAIGKKLIKEVIENIQTFIKFFNKWGDFITDMMAEQRHSLLIAKRNLEASKPKGHKSLLSGAEPGTTSVTHQASQISFDTTPIIERLTTQLEDAYLCLGLTYEKPKKVLKSPQWEAVKSTIEERKLERKAIEQQDTAEPSSPKVERTLSQASPSLEEGKRTSKKNLTSAGTGPSSPRSIKKTASKKDVKK